MPRKMPPPALPVRRTRWPQSRGKSAAEDCSPPSMARNSALEAVTTKVAASFAMVIRQAVSAAVRTAIDLDEHLSQGMCRAGINTAPRASWESRGAPSQMGKSIFVTGKHYELQVRDPNCGLRFFLVRNCTSRQANAWPFASKANEQRCRNFGERQEGRVYPAYRRGNRSRPG